MANSSIAVSLKFNADTTQAKQQIQSLQDQLTKVMQVTSSNAPGNKLVTGLQQSSAAAAQLKVHLQEAFNVNTGKLDLLKFNQSMKESGMSLEKYKAALAQAGPAGQQAFNQLAMSITTAEVPLIRINSHLAKMGQTLANTVRWQLSSSLLTGFMSAISNAYNYAQDLNESLNNIRIVTSYSADEMDRFAEKANKAAKALSTTTTEYTNAALIYYQQGLSEAEIEKRTELTIKMANVTGQSAQNVSDQLTAVWNNFYDGTKSLEHFVDVMTALGAATASSTDEISEGLNKFAAVAETVGLSYEYAASALATVTATTRESADVVGNAFKTLFARIQGLRLGETLDDGTTLNKYSKALESVGISIFEQNGQMKDMNNILDEMGSKWTSLSKDQQVALAQTVAGVRQYTQLIALMDNWDYFQENLGVANTSSGALQEQADIYAESWEAAQDRVTAALESIYEKLLDDDAFIGILNFFADLIENIDDIIDAVGGLKGVLTILGTVLMTVFQKQMSAGLNSMRYGLMGMTSSGREAIKEEQRKATELMVQDYGKTGIKGVEGKAVQALATSQQAYTERADSMSDKQKEIAKYILQQQQGLTDAAQEQAKVAKEAEKTAEAHKKSALMVAEQTGKGENKTYDANVRADLEAAGVSGSLFEKVEGKGKNKTERLKVTDLGQARTQALETFTTKTQQAAAGSTIMAGIHIQDEEMFAKTTWGTTGDTKEQTKALQELESRLKALGVTADGVDETLESIIGPEQARAMQDYAKEVEKAKQKLAEFQKIDPKALEAARGKTADKRTDDEKRIIAIADAYDTQVDSVQKAAETMTQSNQTTQKTADAAERAARTLGVSSQTTNQLKTDFQQLGQETGELGNRMRDAAQGANNMGETLDLVSVKTYSVADGLVASAQMISAVTMAWQSLISVFEIWNNEDASFGEKLLQIFMSLGMVIPMVTSAFSRQNLIQMATFSSSIKVALGMGTEAAAATTAAAASGSFGAALWTVLWPIGLVMLAIAALVAIIYGLVKAFEPAKTAIEKAEENLEQASNTAEKFRNNLEEVRQEAEQVKEVFEEYHTLSDNLNSLAQGTSAWQEKLSEVQIKIKEIMEMYPELAGTYLASTGEKAFSFDSATGLYTMGSWVEQYANEKANREVAKAEIADTFAQLGLNQAKLDKQKANLDSQLSTNLINEAYEGIVQHDAESMYNADKGWWEGTSTLRGKTYTTAYSDTSDQRYILSDDALNMQNLNQVSKYFNNVLTSQADLLARSGQLTSIEDWDNWVNQGNLNKLIEANAIELTPEAMDQLNQEFRDTLSEQLTIYNEWNMATAAQVENIKAQNTILAQSLLSTKQTFGDLEANEKAAATTLAAQRLTKLTNKWNHMFENNGGLTGKGNTWGRVWGEGDETKQLLNLISQATGFTGTEDWTETKDLGYNLENTELGKSIVDKYLELEGLTGAVSNYRAFDMKFEGTDAEGKSLGDEFYISYDEMLTRIMSEYVSGELNEADIIAQTQKISGGKFGEQIIAGITGSLDSLSPELIAEISQNDNQSFTQAYLDEWAKGLNMSVEELQATDMFKEAENQLKNYDAALAETKIKQADVAKGNNLLAQAASELDLDEKTLQNYAKSLQKLNGEQEISYEQAAQLAIRNAKLSKGMQELRDKFDDYYDILKTGDRASYEVVEAATEIAAALSQVFGVEVSSDFVLNENNLAKIKEAVDGNVDALKELEVAAAKDYIANLAINSNYKDQLNTIIDELDSIPDKDIGLTATLDQSYTDQLNEMLANGIITADQLTAAFATVGWAPEFDYDEKDGPATNTHFESVIKDKNGEKLYTLEGDTTSTSTIQVPKLVSDGSGGGTTLTSLGPKNYSSNITSKGNTGGGGGGSKQEKKDNSEIERYHEVKEVINDLSREYDNLAEAKDRAFGLDRLSLMEDELKATEKMIEAQKQYLEEIEQYRKADKEKLAEYGASFDEMGRITNYDEMYEVNIKAYNEAVDKVNAGSMTDEQFEEYEKEFDEFVDDIAQYEETLNLLEDEETNLLNLQNQLFDAKIASITYKVELDTRLADNEIAYLEYQFENLTDSIDDTALSLVNLGKQTEQNLKKIESYQTGIKEMLSLSGFSDQDIETILNGTEDISTILQSKTLTDEQISTLEEYRDALMDVNTQMSEMRKQVHEELIAAFEEMNEEMNREVEAIDHFSDMLQSYRDIIDLVGKDNMGISNAMLQEMSRANVENASAALRSQKAILDANKTALAEAEASLAKAREANQEEDIKLWEETVRTLSETVTSGEEELISRWQSALQAAADAFSDAVDQVMEDFEKAMTGVAGGFDALQEKYNQQKEINDRYLDDYQKIYELSKLNRDITKSIDDTDNIRAKTRLRDIQEEINALQESNTEMTQYEVNELRARYELRLAEIALEEAQNAKNQVRMSRDAEGNWSYVYTANQENVDNAMQNYEDKLYAYQTLTQERAEEIEEQILALPKEFSEAIQEIMMDLTLTEEEKEQKIFDTRKYYEDKYNYLLGQISISLNDAKRLYENDWQAFSQATGYKISDAEEWQDKFDETILAQLTGYTNIEEAQAKFNTATDNMFSDLLSAYKQYKIDTDNIMSEVAIDAEVFTEKITNGTQEAADSIKSLADAAAEGFGGLVDWVNWYANEYGAEIQKYISENDKMITSINSILEKLGKVPSALSQAEAAARQAVEEAQAKEAEIDTIVSSGGGSGGGPGGYVPPPQDPPVQESETKYWRVMYDADGKDKNQATPVVYKTGKYLNAIDALNAAREKYMSQRINSGISRQQAEQDWLKARAAGFYMPEQYIYKAPAGGAGGGKPLTVKQFDSGSNSLLRLNTGGYTGEWGAEGRIAMLHQKELVLNADDTTNFLSAIKIIRDISRVIDLRTTAQQSALSAMTSSTVAPMAQVLQQEVTIHAEFPNATQRTEIEAAFDTLLNRASQFANRKNQ